MRKSGHVCSRRRADRASGSVGGCVPLLKDGKLAGSVTPVPLCGATRHPQTRDRPTRMSARRITGTIPERGRWGRERRAKETGCWSFVLLLADVGEEEALQLSPNVTQPFTAGIGTVILSSPTDLSDVCMQRSEQSRLVS